MGRKKALIVTHVSGFVPQFEMNNVRILQSMGYEVHYASNFHMPSYGNDNARLKGSGIVPHQIDFVRSPFKINANIRAYIQLKKLMQQIEFDLVHCHTPMGGVITRLAAKKTHTRPVLYTAHGFHFYKGAPLFNWIFYYPMELLLSFWTDQLICINREDYLTAKAHFHARKIDFIHGVGIDLKKFNDPSKKSRLSIRDELGISLDTCIFISSGELIKRKNHETIIRAIKYMIKYEKPHNQNFVYLICGKGELDHELRELIAKEKLDQYIRMLGYRTDMVQLLNAADVYVFPSYQEGLPMGLLEAMASGLPVICSNIRGNDDLMLEDGMREKRKKGILYCDGGVLIYPADEAKLYVKAMAHFLDDFTKEQRNRMGDRNRRRAELFSEEVVVGKMRGIYENIQIY